MQKILATVLSVALAGCGHHTIQQSEAKLADHDCVGAENAINGISQLNQGVRSYALGRIYANCYKMPSTAIDHMTLGARHGNQQARATLAGWGQPVPAADLMQAPASQADFTAVAVILGIALGVAAATASAPPPTPAQDYRPLPRTCRSSVMGTMVHTTCD